MLKEVNHFSKRSLIQSQSSNETEELATNMDNINSVLEQCQDKSAVLENQSLDNSEINISVQKNLSPSLELINELKNCNVSKISNIKITPSTLQLESEVVSESESTNIESKENVLHITKSSSPLIAHKPVGESAALVTDSTKSPEAQTSCVIESVVVKSLENKKCYFSNNKKSFKTKNLAPLVLKKDSDFFCLKNGLTMIQRIAITSKDCSLFIQKDDQIVYMKPFNFSKKLLVLGLDGVLCDFEDKPVIDDPAIKRPDMDIFLRKISAYYNIVIWSSSKLVQLAIKLRILNISDNIKYSIVGCLDGSYTTPYCISSFNEDYEEQKARSCSSNLTDTSQINCFGIRNEEKFSMKYALQIIWNQNSEFDKRNTIMIDINESYYHYNKNNGIKISKYYRQNYNNDKNLMHRLYPYLINLNLSSDFSEVDHDQYKP